MVSLSKGITRYLWASEPLTVAELELSDCLMKYHCGLYLNI
jgi:hypothetical protein